jgi:hypothetical protein
MRSLAGEIALRAMGGGVDRESLRRLLEDGARFGALEDGTSSPMLFASC